MPCTSLVCKDHFIYYADGRPFFYLADTAWELFHRLTLEEARLYLRDRAEKGFTVIQAVAVAEAGGTTVENANGHLPFSHLPDLTPCEAYFSHVDQIIDEAEQAGLYIALLPSWGKYWRSGSPDRIFTPENAYPYALFLGKRYRHKPVIWMLGGDSGLYNDHDYAVTDAFARGLREGDGGAHLITFHPIGPGSSVPLLNDRPWLDFHTCQSSHAARDHFNGVFIQEGWRARPPRPILDAEPRYEQIPVGFYNKDATPARRFDDFDARQAAYFSVFSGACGHTYGNNNIWQMYAPGREGIIGANIPWYEAIHHPGARQMGYLRKLMEKCDFTALEDASHLLFDAPVSGGERCLARIHREKKCALIYSPYGRPFGFDCSWVGARGFRQVWFSCKYGASYPHSTLYLGAYQTFAPPTQGRGEDWVLQIFAD